MSRRRRHPPEYGLRLMLEFGGVSMIQEMSWKRTQGTQSIFCRLGGHRHPVFVSKIFRTSEEAKCAKFFN